HLQTPAHVPGVFHGWRRSEPPGWRVGSELRKKEESLALKTDAVGKTYTPVSYAVGREKVREFASAVGEENPLHHDPDAAREAGYGDVVAPPMFAVVFAG